MRVASEMGLVKNCSDQIGALKTIQPREHQFLRNGVGKLSIKGQVVNIFHLGATRSLL